MVAILGSSQQPKKDFGTLGFGLDFPKDNLTYNFSASVNGRISEGPLYLGIGLQLTKFKNISSLYTPLSLNIFIIPEVRGNVFPLLVMQPAYGIYAGEKMSSTNPYPESGGLAFFGGAGIGFSGKQQIYFLAGYSSYGFEANGSKATISGVAARAGIMF